MASNPPPPGAGGNSSPTKPTEAPPIRPMAAMPANFKPDLPLQAPRRSAMPSVAPTAKNVALLKPPSQPTPRPISSTLELRPPMELSGMPSAAVKKPSVAPSAPAPQNIAAMSGVPKASMALPTRMPATISIAQRANFIASAAASARKKTEMPKKPVIATPAGVGTMGVNHLKPSSFKPAEAIFRNPSTAVFKQSTGAMPTMGTNDVVIKSASGKKNASKKKTDPKKAAPKKAKSAAPKIKLPSAKQLAKKAASIMPMQQKMAIAGNGSAASGHAPKPFLAKPRAVFGNGFSINSLGAPVSKSSNGSAAGSVANVGSRMNGSVVGGGVSNDPSEAASAGPSLAETQAPPAGSMTSAASSEASHVDERPLRVEDALLYLDQVKLEFGNKPRIYNEFLEIMKNFKAQTVDTVGVINRVKRLFHGYNNLILGFNTFLPEGYKIEMKDLVPAGPGFMSGKPSPVVPAGRGMSVRGPLPRSGPSGRGSGLPSFGRGGRGMPLPGGRGGPGRGPPLGRSGLMPGRVGPPQLAPGRSMDGRGGVMPVVAAGRGGPPPLRQGGPGRMKPTPQQAHQMQNQQTQQMMQAQNAKQKQIQLQQQQQHHHQHQQRQQHQQQHQHQQHHHQQQQQQQQHQQQQKQQQQQQQSQVATQNTSQQAQPSQQQEQGAAVTRIEFDHAILYVTNIKMRFADQPRVYQTFLEILHTYQKEQRGIKEVLEQVSTLFADHPDLLREFTFFLPDAVHEQARERLSRAAAEAEAKQRAAAVEAAAKQHQSGQNVQQQIQASADSVNSTKNSKSTPTGWRGKINTPGKGKASPGQSNGGGSVAQQTPLPIGAISGAISEAQKFIDMTQPSEVGLESPSRGGPARSPTATTKDIRSIKTKQANVYNAGVERQFFDAVKAALTSFSRDGQAYAEFIKTLDMYAQEILSRNDMMGYVERLLGKHKHLFEEFKHIINAVGSPEGPTHDDSWHSVPLSEIDFSRCRRCSPSYRALPRDYPNPPCSERSVEEVRVLNDDWVSLPMGSEESNTFRHMRKNQYEETLFRCEDMRFEIDMCIDSNASTLQRLTKINDELQFLSENELLLAKGGGSMVKKSICPEGAGLGGKLYQYTLDGRVLGVIHKHAIKRIYGEDGKEMLDLCFKNPAVALPIVVNRLRQKDEEWRAARDELNRKWKDLAEYNYYKSVDHRSITWRTTDKRATSTRTIVAEIKDRAAHNGLEGEAAYNARVEKAKEEHGTFYEITKGCSIPRKMDLTNLPKPTATIFTPHLSFVYDNNSWAQQDAYRIICFALERASIAPTDKEQCFRLWRDFIGPWFGMSLAWMQSPATLFTPSPPVDDDEEDEDSSKESGNEEDADSSLGDNNSNNPVSATNGKMVKEGTKKPKSTSDVDTGYFSSTNHIPFPPETLVSTTFGEGKVIQYIRDDKVYEVSYPSSATAYLKPDAVFGSLDPVEPSLLTDQLRMNDQEEPERADDQMIIGTQCLYLFFRLHQVLVRRLNIAKKLAIAVSKDTALGRHIEKLTFEGDPDEGKKRYEAFLGLVYALIDAGTGSCEASEGGKYEDRVRSLLGNNAYELTTMDKLISHVLKHLQNMANDDTMQNTIEIYRRHELAGNFKPSAFREEAALMSEGENMFAFQICNMPKTDQKIAHCEFLGCIADDVEEDDDAALENHEYHKRGIEDVAMDGIGDFPEGAKRSKKAA